MIRWPPFLAPVLMIVGVLLVYLPHELFQGKQLFGADYIMLHSYRLRFAQQALFFSDVPHLPGWYPLELMGAPFWANIQSFPFIPTRLLLLFFDRGAAFTIGVNLAAVLSALFTYLYCRQLKMGTLSAALAGWTFACSGFFASRVMAGHLPLLEAYPGLPMLLWLIERHIHMEKTEGLAWPWLGALGIATWFLSLAGHPQLPIYAIAVSMLYVIFRDFGPRVLPRLGAMFLGGGASAFCMIPMYLLTRQSTRFLNLNPPVNNIVLPFARLKAFVLPWADGWAQPVMRSPWVPFDPSYPTRAYFWDTVNYTGVIPLVALLIAGIIALIRFRKGQPAWRAPWVFWATVGTLALLLALPPVQCLLQLIPGTILRSPARQVYITVFALSIGFGAVLNMSTERIRFKGRAGPIVLIAVLIVGSMHVSDLARHALSFIYVLPIAKPESTILDAVSRIAGDQRVSIQKDYMPHIKQKYDDISFFDSAVLGHAYRAVMAVSGKPPGTNTQYLYGNQLTPRALAYFGVRLLFSQSPYPGVARYPLGSPVPAYNIANPAPRVAYYPLSSARYFDPQETETVLRDEDADIRNIIMLPRMAKPADAPDNRPVHGDLPGNVRRVPYTRKSSDEFSCTVETPTSGYVRFLETWYQGWHATVDGADAPVLLADGFAMAVYVPPGKHTVTLRYSTPGKWPGLGVTVICLLLLVLLVVPRKKSL